MTIPKVSIEKINKYPWAYVLMILGGLVGVLAANYFDSNKVIRKNLEAENAGLHKRIDTQSTECKDEVAFWRTKYLKEVDYNVFEKRKQDSINNAKLQQPNEDFKNVIKNKKIK